MPTERPSISTQNKRRLYNLVPTIFTAMVVIIIIFAPISSDPMENDAWLERIFQFQGLIAGFLAILAAYVTIYQMRISDEKSDRRHEDALRISMLPDRRRVERAINPAAAMIKRSKNGLVLNARQINEPGNATREKSRKVLYRINSELERLEAEIAKDTFYQGMQIFNGILSDACIRLLTSSRKLRGYVEDLANESRTLTDDGFQRSFEGELGRRAWISSELRFLIYDVDVILMGLERFSEEFGVAIHYPSDPPIPPAME